MEGRLLTHFLDVFVRCGVEGRLAGGIGEGSAHVRAAVVEGLNWMELRLDPTANVQNSQTISSSDSVVRVMMLETDEEAMIARHMCEVLTASTSDKSGPAYGNSPARAIS